MSNSVSSSFITRLTMLKKMPRPAVPLRLRGRPAYISLTRHGLVFFAMLVALLIGSINHNNNLGYLLTFLLGSMALVSIFHTYRNLSGFEVISARAEPVFAGQNASFQVTLITQSQEHPSLTFSFPGGEPRVVNLQEGSRQTISLLHHTDKRGILNTSILEVTTSYPLNFFSVRSSIQMKGSCLVYPKPAPGPLVTAKGPPDEDSEGETGGPGVEDFSSLVTYQRGDPLQHISWKAYSKGQGLYTKKFEGQQGKTIYFDLDVLAGKDRELKLSRICFMIIKADALRMSYGLHLGGKVIPPDCGGSHKRLCLQELALLGSEE